MTNMQANLDNLALHVPQVSIDLPVHINREHYHDLIEPEQPGCYKVTESSCLKTFLCCLFPCINTTSHKEIYLTDRIQNRETVLFKQDKQLILYQDSDLDLTHLSITNEKTCHDSFINMCISCKRCNLSCEKNTRWFIKRHTKYCHEDPKNAGYITGIMNLKTVQDDRLGLQSLLTNQAFSQEIVINTQPRAHEIFRVEGDLYRIDNPSIKV